MTVVDGCLYPPSAWSFIWNVPAGNGVATISPGPTISPPPIEPAPIDPLVLAADVDSLNFVGMKYLPFIVYCSGLPGGTHVYESKYVLFTLTLTVLS